MPRGKPRGLLSELLSESAEPASSSPRETVFRQPLEDAQVPCGAPQGRWEGRSPLTSRSARARKGLQRIGSRGHRTQRVPSSDGLRGRRSRRGGVSTSSSWVEGRFRSNSRKCSGPLVPGAERHSCHEGLTFPASGHQPAADVERAACPFPSQEFTSGGRNPQFLLS